MATMNESKIFMNDMFQQATESFGHATETFSKALGTGMKFQEETARFWSDTLGKNTAMFGNNAMFGQNEMFGKGSDFSKGMEQVQSQFEKMTKEVFPTTKKQLDTFQTMFDEQSKRGMEMMKGAFDACQNSTGSFVADANAFDHAMKMWRTSFDTMRSSVDTFAQANTEMFESFSSMAKNACCANTNGANTAAGTTATKGNSKSSK